MSILGNIFRLYIYPIFNFIISLFFTLINAIGQDAGQFIVGCFLIYTLVRLLLIPIIGGRFNVGSDSVRRNVPQNKSKSTKSKSND